MKKKIDIAASPELNTSVGIHGSMKQSAVVNPLVAAALVGLIIAL